MLFRSDMRRGIVLMEKLFRLMKGQSQRLSDLPGAQFPLSEALQNESFQQLPRMLAIIQMELLGQLVGDIDGDDHRISIL